MKSPVYDVIAVPIEKIQANSYNPNHVGNQTNYRTTKKPVTFADYPDDTPVTNFRSVPSYKRMCITIMKNDHTAKYMGFSQTKAQVEKRRKAIEKYENIL